MFLNHVYEASSKRNGTFLKFTGSRRRVVDVFLFLFNRVRGARALAEIRRNVRP